MTRKAETATYVYTNVNNERVVAEVEIVEEESPLILTIRFTSGDRTPFVWVVGEVHRH
jgi:hypothetical protein